MSSNDLKRMPYLILGSGFSFALLLNQIINMSVTKSPIHIKIILVSYTLFLIIQTTRAWSFLEGFTIPYMNYMFTFSTFLGSIMACGIFYASLLRFNAMYITTNYILKIGYIFILVVMVLRTIRTLAIFIQPGNSPQFYLSNIINVITILPLLCIRMVMDVISFKKIYQMRVEGSDRHRQKAFKKIILSLGFEIFLSIGTILSIIADVMEYNGTRFYHFDYFLIAWSLAAMTEQKKLYQIIFGKEEASSSAYTNQTKLTATKSIVNGVNVFDQGTQKSNGNAVFV